METFKIHISIYMYVSTHILESPSQKCFQFYIIVTCAHIQMIQSPDPDKTNWICHVATAQPKSQLKSQSSHVIHVPSDLDCSLTNLWTHQKYVVCQVSVSENVHGSKATNTNTPWPHGGDIWSKSSPNHLMQEVQLVSQSLDVPCNTSHSPVHTRLYTDGRGFHARCRPPHQERYSPSFLKHPGYISGQPFTWQEQAPGAIWGSGSRWRTLYCETGGNIEALTFRLVDKPLYLVSKSN